MQIQSSAPEITYPDLTYRDIPRVRNPEAAANWNAKAAQVEAQMGELAKPSAAAGSTLDSATASALLREAGGDKAKARALAKERGYKF